METGFSGKGGLKNKLEDPFGFVESENSAKWVSSPAASTSF